MVELLHHFNYKTLRLLPKLKEEGEGEQGDAVQAVEEEILRKDNNCKKIKYINERKFGKHIINGKINDNSK